MRVWRAAPFSTVREPGVGWAGSCILYDIFVFPAKKGRRGRGGTKQRLGTSI